MRKIGSPALYTARLALSVCLGLLITWNWHQLVQAETVPEKALISGFIGHAQGHSLSCEARSAVDWMAFWGVYATESEFLSRLPVSDNPDVGFVGSPDDLWGNIPPNSYGVHADPVAALIREYGLQAEAKRGASWEDLRHEIAAGRPVIVWVIGQMWRGIPISYTSANGSTTTVARFEHTMVLVGYDPIWVYMIDAFSGQLQTYTVEAFLRSWEVLENMVVLGGQDLPEEDLPASDRVKTDVYIVQRGDFLVALSNRFGINWQDLASANQLSYPYVIYPGQTLVIPRISAQEEVQPEEQPIEPTPSSSVSEPPSVESPSPSLIAPTSVVLLLAEELHGQSHPFYLPIITNNLTISMPATHGMARRIFPKEIKE